MDYNGEQNAARTDGEQSETPTDFRVSFESDKPLFPELPIGSPERAAVFAELRKTFAEDWKAAEIAVAEEKRKAKGDLYFVRVGRFLKIGRTTNLKARMRMIRCHAPSPPELVGVIEGAGHREPEWHRQFKHLQSNREWFRITPELKRAVDAALGKNAKTASAHIPRRTPK